MTLTKQWKKGELPRGWYYVVLDNKETNIALCKDLFTNCGRKLKRDFAINDVIEVLAPVPSYEEWQELSKQRNQFIRDVNDLAYIQEENQQLKKDNHIFEKKINNSYLKIGQLRQLVKECKANFIHRKQLLEKLEELEKPTIDLLTRINAAIGESEE